MPESPQPGDAREPQHHRIALVASLTLGLATTLSAWSAFQAVKWSGRQTIAFNEATAMRTLAARFATRADQQTVVDATLFIAWAQAVAAELRPAELRDQGYEPKAGTLSRFLFERFPKESKPAMRAWLATHPFQNPEAPPTPFEMPEYKREAADKASALNDKADARTADARLFNLRSDRYVATTVVFSTVLFLAGVVTQLEHRLSQRLLLGLAWIALLGGVAALVTFPVALG